MSHEVVIGVRADTGRITTELRELEYIFYRVTSLMVRMGLSPEMTAAIQQLQKLVLTVRLLHTAFMQLQRGTPLGLIISIASLGSAAFTASDLASGFPTYDYQRGQE